MDNRNKSLRRALLAPVFATLSMVSISANADIVEYSFISPDGEARSVGPSSTYVNPVGEMVFAVSAGIDRRVKVDLLDEAGNIAGTQTSSLLGAEDRITVDGNSYYGAFLKLDAPPDGSYTLRSEIISSDENVVSFDEYPMEVSTTAPRFDTIAPLRKGYNQVISGDLWKLGSNSGGSPQTLRIQGIESSLPIESVKLRLYREDGSLYRDELLNLSEGESYVDHRVNQQSFFPESNLDEVFSLKVVITDKAGNESVSEPQNVMMDNYGGQPNRPFAVYDPNASGSVVPGKVGFVSYSDNMVVNANPIELVYRIEKTNWHEYHLGGLITVNDLGETKKIAEDDKYVYVNFVVPYAGSYNSNFVRWTTFGVWGLNSIYYQASLSDESLMGPSITSSEILYSDIGWGSSNRRVPTSALPVSLSGIRVNVKERNYDQYVNLYNDCVIPAGETSCTISYNRELQAGTYGYTRKDYSVSNAEGSLSDPARFGTVSWNASTPPSITYTLSGETLYSEVTQKYSGDNNNPVDLASVWLESNGSTLSASGGKLYEIDELHAFEWDLSSLAEGEHEIYVHATERHGLETVAGPITYIADRSSPEVEIMGTNEGSITSLDEIQLTISDNDDATPSTSVVLEGGPAHEQVNLTLRPIGGNQYQLEYPVMFPTMKAGEEYQLTVEAIDSAGNTGIDKVVFSYNPPQVSIADTSDGPIMLPAVAQKMLRQDGGDAVRSQPLTLSDGAMVVGTYDVHATLRSDSDMPLIINGVRVEPGDTQEIMGQHDFSSSGGRLSIPVYPAEDGVVGQASILVSTTAPNAPVLVAEIQTWQGAAELQASSWDVRQVVDPVNVTAVPAAGTHCAFTVNESEARAADAITNPKCYVEWKALPDETQPVEGVNKPTLAGQAATIGPQPVTYSLWLFSGDGTKIKVGEGSQNLNVLSALGAVSYAPDGDYSAIERVIGELDLRLDKASGVNCRLTFDREEARYDASLRSYDASIRTCLFEWTLIPEGLSQREEISDPALFGALPSNGDHDLGWRITTFSQAGEEVLIAREMTTLTAIDPVAPSIELDSEFLLEGSRYVVPMDTPYLGDARIEGVRTDMEIRVQRGAEVLEDEIYAPGWGTTHQQTRRLRQDNVPVWTETEHSVTATYTRVPDITATGTYTAIAAPSMNVRPEVIVESDQVLDTEPLAVEVQMRDLLDREAGYDSATMGEWEIRLINQVTITETEPMTDFQAIDGEGNAHFSVDLETLESRSLRLMAEARLVSPVDGYERTEMARPVFLSILIGGALEGEITSRSFSGEAPLNTMFQLALEDRMNQQAAGEVVWELSTDGGVSWEAYSGEERRPMMFYRVFDEGTYLIRATVENAFSGVKTATEAVEVVAYTTPELEILGPEVLFVGDSATFEAQASVPTGDDAETVSDSEGTAADAETTLREGMRLATPEEVQVEWSIDGGQSWEFEGPTLTLQRDTAERIPLRARVRSATAPDEDRYAYEMMRHTIDFRDVKAAYVRVRTNSLMEAGKPYTVNSWSRLPYRGMDYTMKGFFTLPDGSTVDAEEIEYTPTGVDAEAGMINLTYTGWIEGYRAETENSYTQRVRVWDYVWPRFNMLERLSAEVAPADVTLTVRHSGGTKRLEEPEYTWELPEGVTAVEARGDATRMFRIEEAGTHRIKVTVRDARGNVEVVEHDIVLGEPDPYEINLRYLPSNDQEREPLYVRMRPTIRGGHPRDRVSETRFLVNGEVVAEGDLFAGVTLYEGRHDLAFEIVSDFGVEASKSLSLMVNDNQLPTCELERSESDSSWIYLATCEDTDGRVRSYEWTVDGELSGQSSNRLSIIKRHYEAEPSISVIGFDDAGEASAPAGL